MFGVLYMKIGFVGLGLMGGSIASALKKEHDILAYDVRKDSLDYALENHIIDRAFTDPKSLLAETDILFICLYPRDCVSFVKKWNSYFKPDCLVIEISGIKSGIIRDVSLYVNGQFDMVFTHPIAGKEKSGVEYADKTIFLDQNFVIVPVASNQEKNLLLVENLARQMGFGNVVRIDSQVHDEIIAYTSQLAHVLALALIDSDDNQVTTSRFIGDSFRDLTRIAMINDDLWSELMIENKSALLDKIEMLQKELSRYRLLIAGGDYEGLRKAMKKSKEARLGIEKDIKS